MKGGEKMADKYLLEKELMEIPTTNEANEKYKEISEKYPVLKELEEKLRYEQFANLFFVVDRLYCYQLMWESLKSAKCKEDKALEASLKALMEDIEEKYSYESKLLF
ncbi:hypothetical protein KAX02_05550 [candidate division WOR-3 bacterium]|nr:hypothetical protein [candidate division WOR-3 bacterium]